MSKIRKSAALATGAALTIGLSGCLGCHEKKEDFGPFATPSTTPNTTPSTPETTTPIATTPSTAEQEQVRALAQQVVQQVFANNNTIISEATVSKEKPEARRTIVTDDVESNRYPGFAITRSITRARGVKLEDGRCQESIATINISKRAVDTDDIALVTVFREDSTGQCDPDSEEAYETVDMIPEDSTSKQTTYTLEQAEDGTFSSSVQTETTGVEDVAVDTTTPIANNAPYITDTTNFVVTPQGTPKLTTRTP